MNVVSNGSFLANYCGWIGGQGYGSDGTNNFIIGCSSNGDISAFGGGIVGSEAATVNVSSSADLNIIGCSSSGLISSGSGGIAGEYCGQNSNSNVNIFKCSSSGTISSNSGGIVGRFAGYQANCTIEKCYSTGNIGENAGGIFGIEAGGYGGSAIAQDCYSLGNIELNAGGIFGSSPGIAGGSVNATNCYSTGTITTTGNGIFGSNKSGSEIEITCYIADGDWNSINASSTLNISPYISVVDNQPFELRNFGPSPYSLTNIIDEDMTLTYIQSISAGSSSIAGVLSGFSSYSILRINEQPANIFPTITINSTTGAISTTTSTPVSSYSIIVRAVVNPYSITTFTLNVTEAPTPTPSTNVITVPTGKGFDFETYNALQAGNQYLLERKQNTNLKFKSFEDYNKYKKAFATLK